MAQSDSKKPLLIGAIVVLALLGACCCSGLIGVAVLGKRENDARAATFGNLSMACRGQGIPEAAELVADGTIHAQAYDEDGDMLHMYLPSEMRSTALSDTEVVVCRMGRAESYVVERCDYETGIVTGITGGENVIEREAYHTRFRVVAARTGATIAEELIDGEMPDPCPESAEFDTGGETDTLRGDWPDGDEVSAWMRTLPL
ncbi:MAG: hypothetical protein AB7S26_40100 [Sandaracinaceae bacterium]